MRIITTWSGLVSEIETGPAGKLVQPHYERLLDFGDQPLSELCKVVIVEPSDRQSDLEQALRQSLHPPPWEYVTVADGWYEFVLVTGDDGFGFVVLIEDRMDGNRALLDYCATLIP